MKHGVSRRGALRVAASAGLAAGGWLGGSRPAAAETTLTLSSWAPANHPVVIGALQPWCDDVFKATEGRVRVRIAPKPLGPPAQHFDLARNGAADITYGLAGATPGNRFALARLAEFSFLGDDAATLSVAFWRQYEMRLRPVNEFVGVHTLSVFCHGPGALHARRRRIRAVGDLQGLTIRVPGGYIDELLARLGAHPLRAPASEVYEMLADRGLDGTAGPLEALTSYRLTDFITETITVPGGLYNSSWFLAMNEARWNRLSDADRLAIDALAGESFARRVGLAWNAADAAARERILAAGIAITPAPAALLKPLVAVAASLEAAWEREAARRGVDGRTALAEMRAATGISVPA